MRGHDLKGFLDSKSHQELIDLIITICDRNSLANVLLTNVVSGKFPSPIKALHVVKNEFTSNHGSVAAAHRAFMDYAATTLTDEDILKVVKGILPLFLEAVDRQGPLERDERLDSCLEVFDTGIQSAIRLEDVKSAKELMDMIPLSVRELTDDFHDLFGFYGIDDSE